MMSDNKYFNQFKAFKDFMNNSRGLWVPIPSWWVNGLIS